MYLLVESEAKNHHEFLPRKPPWFEVAKRGSAQTLSNDWRTALEYFFHAAEHFWTKQRPESHAYIRWVRTLVIWVVATQIFLFHPEPWGNDAIWRTYFLDWLKPPTSCCSMLFSHHWWLQTLKPKTLTAWTTPPHQFRKKSEVGSWN